MVVSHKFFAHATIDCPVSWYSRIHRLFLCRGVRHPTNECPGHYDTKMSDSEAPVMLEFWRMWRTPSLPSLRGPHFPGTLASDKVLSMG